MQKNKIIATANLSHFSTHPNESVEQVMERLLTFSADKTEKHMKECRNIIRDIIKTNSLTCPDSYIEDFFDLFTVLSPEAILSRFSNNGYSISKELAATIFNALPRTQFQTILDKITSADLELLSLTRIGNHYISPLSTREICSPSDFADYVGNYFSDTTNPNGAIANNYLRKIVALSTIYKVNGTDPAICVIALKAPNGTQIGKMTFTIMTTLDGKRQGTETIRATYKNTGIATRLYNEMLSNFARTVPKGDSSFTEDNQLLFRKKFNELQLKYPDKTLPELYKKALLEGVPSAKLWHKNGFTPVSIEPNSLSVKVLWERK